MKSYTDISQSKKLAEILPLESADMMHDRLIVIPFNDGSLTPCWSLAALSEFILPYIVDDDGNNYKFYLSKDDLDRWIAYYKSDDISIHICEESDNMIDVILEMVYWLKKRRIYLIMKSYTDLEQSKKLAEFLPLESADMFYNKEPEDETYPKDIVDIEYPMILREGHIRFLEEYGIPCWSLAALLDVLPDEISTGEGYQNKYEIDIRRYYGGNNITLYQIAYGNNKGLSGSWHDMISTSEQEKFVDVCYEMILKLHKLNLL